jgi:ketosteroid isomerase-like protein
MGTGRAAGFLALLASCGAAPRPRVAPTADQAGDAQALIELEHRWAAAYVNADAELLDKLYRDDLVLVSSRGEVLTKQQEVAEVRTGAVRYRRFDTKDLVPRVFGDTAVVTAVSHIEAVVTETQREIVVDMRVIDVFVRSGGRWQVLATQGTRLGS